MTFHSKLKIGDLVCAAASHNRIIGMITYIGEGKNKDDAFNHLVKINWFNNPQVEETFVTKDHAESLKHLLTHYLNRDILAASV